MYAGQGTEEGERLDKIKSISEEILKECRKFTGSFGELVWSIQRKLQMERADVVKRQEHLQQALQDLKGENRRLLDERQRLVAESESDQRELERLKGENQALEARIADGSARKRSVLAKAGSLQQEVQRLMKAIEVTTAKEEALAEDACRRLEMYRRYLGLHIVPMEDGCIKFVFQKFRGHPSAKHHFTVEMDGEYAVREASVSEALYSHLFQALRETGDFFVFLRGMRGLFAEHLEREKENLE